MLRRHWWRALVVLSFIALRPPPVGAQVSAADSAARHKLDVHVPFFIPFFHHRHQAGRTLSAEPDSTEVVSLETGYDGDFNSPELKRDETTSITLVVTPMSRLELQADVDFWALEAAPASGAVNGLGDAHLRAQWTAFTTHPDHLAIAIAYIVKLPTASSATLGTGRVDQRLLIPVSAVFRGLQVDAYLGVDTDALPTGAIWGAEEAAGVTTGIGHSLSVHAGFFASAIDTDQPAGTYLTGGITWQLHRLAAIDLGARAGLSAGTPAFGITAGITTTLVTR
jgi:hypothetical protein